MLRRILAVLALLALSGCSTQIGEFTVLSTHNVEISRIDLKKMDLSRHHGHSERFWILFVPIGRAPSVNEAIDRCIERGHGDFIMNARVYDDSWTCLLFSWGSYAAYGEVGLSTKGNVRDIREEPAPAPIPQPGLVESCPPPAQTGPPPPTPPR